MGSHYAEFIAREDRGSILRFLTFPLLIKKEVPYVILTRRPFIEGNELP